ncbi:hypothetical protein EX30DRAFT_367277 [Ascodesmis nigricans]|uniref:Uncharacterized protein n=1 Tax=Ascodesmis nigricans TaxID=341454 RepID=A0A4S2MI55_9PEZI|nr:hypothetical protein EX30DRAFT_367277 [Ascodesmis nigricans]
MPMVHAHTKSDRPAAWGREQQRAGDNRVQVERGREREREHEREKEKERMREKEKEKKECARAHEREREREKEKVQKKHIAPPGHRSTSRTHRLSHNPPHLLPHTIPRPKEKRPFPNLPDDKFRTPGIVNGLTHNGKQVMSMDFVDSGGVTRVTV